MFILKIYKGPPPLKCGRARHYEAVLCACGESSCVAPGCSSPLSLIGPSKTRRPPAAPPPPPSHPPKRLIICLTRYVISEDVEIRRLPLIPTILTCSVQIVCCQTQTFHHFVLQTRKMGPQPTSTNRLYLPFSFFANFSIRIKQG
jgi:hypothetical protein